METFRTFALVIGTAFVVLGLVIVVALEMQASGLRLGGRLRHAVEVLLPPLAFAALLGFVWSAHGPG